MDHVVVEGLRPYDGRYPFDFVAPNLTVREWGWIKRFSDTYPANYIEHAGRGDAELVAVVLAISLRRANKLDAGEIPAFMERLADVDLEQVLRIDAATRDEEPDDAGPPPGSSSGNGSSSGTDGTTSSEISTPTPPSTGDPDSGFSEFDLIRSGS